MNKRFKIGDEVSFIERGAYYEGEIIELGGNIGKNRTYLVIDEIGDEHTVTDNNLTLTK